jgi:hypothetical protein
MLEIAGYRLCDRPTRIAYDALAYDITTRDLVKRRQRIAEGEVAHMPDMERLSSIRVTKVDQQPILTNVWRIETVSESKTHKLTGTNDYLSAKSQLGGRLSPSHLLDATILICDRFGQVPTH